MVKFGEIDHRYTACDVYKRFRQGSVDKSTFRYLIYPTLDRIEIGVTLWNTDSTHHKIT